MSFLSDPKYLRHKGFETADTADPSFELMCLPFEKNASKLQFKPQVKERARMFLRMVSRYIIQTSARSQQNLQITVTEQD